jgi:hypothetical protein
MLLLLLLLKSSLLVPLLQHPAGRLHQCVYLHHA